MEIYLQGQESKQKEEYQQVKAVMEKTLKSDETGSLGLTLATSYVKAEDSNILITEWYIKWVIEELDLQGLEDWCNVKH